MKFLVSVLAFGGMWGFLEATLGFGLHLLAAGISGAIMFPIGVMFMLGAFRATGRASAALYTAMVASAVKAVDLLVPGAAFSMTLNPMLAIVLEGLAVFAATGIFSARRKGQLDAAVSPALLVAFAAAVSFGWRALFAGATVVAPAIGVTLDTFASASSLVQFVLVGGLYNAAITAVALIIFSAAKIRAPRFVATPAFALVAVAASLAAEYLARLAG